MSPDAADEQQHERYQRLHKDDVNRMNDSRFAKNKSHFPGGTDMHRTILAAVPALLLIAPASSMALATATPTTYTNLHWVAGSGAAVPAPAACGSITDIRLDVTLNGGSTNFTANGQGACTNPSDFLIFTGSGVLMSGEGEAFFNLYFGDTRMSCGVSLSGFAGSCSIYLLADFSLAATFDITFTTAP